MASLVSARSPMAVKIYAPFNIYFDGAADSVSAINDSGPFDVLPRHKNFMCLLKPGKVTVRRFGQKDFILQANQAVMHVKSNKVTVFLDV